jgi:hypothetical protein
MYFTEEDTKEETVELKLESESAEGTTDTSDPPKETIQPLADSNSVDQKPDVQDSESEKQNHIIFIYPSRVSEFILPV